MTLDIITNNTDIIQWQGEGREDNIEFSFARVCPVKYFLTCESKWWHCASRRSRGDRYSRRDTAIQNVLNHFYLFPLFLLGKKINRRERSSIWRSVFLRLLFTTCIRQSQATKSQHWQRAKQWASYSQRKPRSRKLLTNNHNYYGGELWSEFGQQVI